MANLIFSVRKIRILIAFAIVLVAIEALKIEVPIGEDLFINPVEIFISLGAAFCGPIGGLLLGCIYGVSSYAVNGFASGVRNIPAHMFAGFVWGIWSVYLWRVTVNRNNGKLIRIGLWTATMPIYYYVLLMPLLLWIHATVNLHTSFSPLFIKIAPLAFIEMVLTIIITDIVLAVLPDKFAAPIK